MFEWEQSRFENNVKWEFNNSFFLLATSIYKTPVSQIFSILCFSCLRLDNPNGETEIKMSTF